jgi:hypothetical protein
VNAKDIAQDLLAAYGQLTGLPHLRFNSDGCARLLFDGSVSVDLEVDDAAACIQAYGVLGPVPAGNREALYRRLLEGNLFGTQTGGAALSIDPVQEEVLLCRRLELAATDAAAMAESLQSFAGVVAQWRDRLGSGELVCGTLDSTDTQALTSQLHHLRG